MDANLDTTSAPSFIAQPTIFCQRPRATLARRVSDAEVVTLCVAQSIMGIPSDRRFLAAAAKRLAHLFPELPAQAAYFKRRRCLADTVEWLMGVFASQSPGYCDELLLIDSTPVECARSRETVKRSETWRCWSRSATAPPTRATSGAFVCMRSSPPMALPEYLRWPRPSAMNARWGSSCWRAVSASAARS